MLFFYTVVGKGRISGVAQRSPRTHNFYHNFFIERSKHNNQVRFSNSQQAFQISVPKIFAYSRKRLNRNFAPKPYIHRRPYADERWTNSVRGLLCEPARICTYTDAPGGLFSKAWRAVQTEKNNMQFTVFRKSAPKILCNPRKRRRMYPEKGSPIYICTYF